MRQYLQSISDAVKEARWLTREPLLWFGSAFAFLTIGVLALDIAVALPGSGFSATAGEYIGRDFFTFWSSALTAAAGRPEAAYVVGPHHPIDHAMPYPPITMLLCWPLAGLSFAQGFFAWTGLGLAFFAYPLARIIGWEMAVLAAIGAPAALINIRLGQSGYFTAALLAGGLMLVERRPLLSGILLGMLCCKPQLAILVGPALVAGRHWRILIAAAATALALAAASAILLGPDTWINFVDRLVVQRQFMESRVAAWSWMPTAFAMMRLMGATPPAAYLIQGLSTICAAIAIAILWRERCPLCIKSAGLAIASFLATPYAWDYDAVALTFAAAWLGNESVRTGFGPWEKIVVLVLLMLPALSVMTAKLLDLQIAPILLWLSLAVVMRRALNWRFGMAVPPIRDPAPQSTA